MNDVLELSAVLKPQGQNRWYAYRAQRHSPTSGTSAMSSSAASEEDEGRDAMAAMIAEGFQQEAIDKKKSAQVTHPPSFSSPLSSFLLLLSFPRPLFAHIFPPLTR